jgi:thioredoxin-like negative regulator of GroEL
MKRISISIILCVIFLFLGMTLSAQTERKPEFLTKETFKQKVWDFEASPNVIKYIGDKPCVIDFTADWCGYCRRIAPFMAEFCNTFQDEIYVYKVNVDKEKELQALFQARSIPVVVFFPMKGQPTATKGALAKEQYLDLINKVLLKKTE